MSLRLHVIRMYVLFCKGKNPKLFGIFVQYLKIDGNFQL